jgi:hypothetical protein
MLVFVIALSLVAYIIVNKIINNKWRPIYIAAVTGIFLTLLTLFFLQGHSVLFKEEASVLARLHGLKKLLRIKPAPENFIDSNFILINTSLNPELIPYKKANYEDSAKQVITNRRMLTAFLRFADSASKLIDLVVCDVLFSDSMRQDKKLIAVIEELQRKNKLVLAYNKDFASGYRSFYGPLDGSSYGDVTKVKGEPFYFSHELVNDENIPSLPYAMYLKLHHKQPPIIGKYYINEDGYMAAKNFIPQFNYINEKELYNERMPGAAIPAIKVDPDTQLHSIHPRAIYTLGFAAGQDGQQEIIDLLTVKSKNYKTIVFIGGFSDAYADRHATAYGELYGTTLLLNEFYFINEGHHKMSVWRFVLYIVTLVLLYASLSWWMICKKAQPYKGSMQVSKRGFIRAWAMEMFEFIVEEGYYLVLFAIALIIDIVFHKIINVMGLLYFFLVFSALLNFFAKHSQPLLHTPIKE